MDAKEIVCRKLRKKGKAFVPNDIGNVHYVKRRWKMWGPNKYKRKKCKSCGEGFLIAYENFHLNGKSDDYLLSSEYFHCCSNLACDYQESQGFNGINNCQ